MRFRVVAAFLIFIGSYFPLAVILAVQDIPVSWWSRSICTLDTIQNQGCSYMPFTNPVWAVAFLALSGLSVFASHVLFNQLSYPFTIEVVQAKATPNELINYAFPYVVSFMGVEFGNTDKLIGFVVFLFWMFAITFKSGQTLMNPLLLMFKWKLSDATIFINNVGREIKVLHRVDLLPGKYQAEKVQDFYIVKD